MIAPVIEKLSEEYKGKVNFYKIDSEKEQEPAGTTVDRAFPACYSFQRP